MRLHYFVLEIRKTEMFAKWLDALRDVRARARVQVRIDYGPGYRVYFKRIGRQIVILLAGGDKRTQSADIQTALRLARNL